MENYSGMDLSLMHQRNGELNNMPDLFVVILKYKAPLEEIDQRIEEHRKFLSLGYDSGYFIMSGRQNPRVGGIILAGNISKLELEEFLKQDPFKQHDLADYEIIEFFAKSFNLDNLGEI